MMSEGYFEDMLRHGCVNHIKASGSGATMSVFIFIGFLYGTQYFRMCVFEEYNN